jgi:hypothetical protein
MARIGQRNIDLGEMTADQMPDLLREVLELTPEAEVLAILREWITRNGLEGELE